MRLTVGALRRLIRETIAEEAGGLRLEPEADKGRAGGLKVAPEERGGALRHEPEATKGGKVEFRKETFAESRRR